MQRWIVTEQFEDLKLEGTVTAQLLRLSVHFDHLKLSQLSLQVFLRNHFDAFKFS